MVVEVFAAGLAVRTCKALGYTTKVHFEGDAKVVVDSINGEKVDRGRLGHLVADLQADVKTLENWKMTFVQRNGNNATHMLARYAVKHGLDKMWVVPLDCIREILLLKQFALSALIYNEIVIFVFF
jgi:hypothetical protein